MFNLDINLTLSSSDTGTTRQAAVQNPSSKNVIQWNQILMTNISGILVLSSTGGAAEYNGDTLGEYVEEGEYEGRPYFKQRDTEGVNDTYLCTRFWGNGSFSFCI